jgi:HSP20 family protein
VNIVPPVDMAETDKELIVKAVLPGVAEEDISVDIVGDTLTIKGETRSGKEEKDETHLYREFRYGTFSRSLTLPGGLKTDRAEAELENGILKLSIPKAENAMPKAIKVKSKKVEKSLKEAITEN